MAAQKKQRKKPGKNNSQPKGVSKKKSTKNQKSKNQKTLDNNKIQRILSITKSISSTWNTFKQNKGKVGINVILDVVFFFIALFIAQHYLTIIQGYVIQLLDVVQSFTNSLDLSGQQMNELLLLKQSAQAYFNTILVNLAWMILYILICYCILQSIAWYCAYLANAKHTWKTFFSFLGKFSFLSTIQTLLLVALVAFVTSSGTISSGGMVLVGKEGVLLVKKIFFGLLFVLFDYLSVLSYAYVPHKHWLKSMLRDSFKRFSYLFSCYLLFALSMCLAGVIFYYLSQMQVVVALLFGILVLLPLLTYFRMFLFEVVKESP